MEGFKHYRPTSAGIEHKRRYHVFLSFRGTDVRKGLVDHLFQSLSTAGLHVFLDSERLEKGENIGESLEKAIEDSTLYLPIFSPDYASSAWCLKELSHIWKICRSGSRDRKIIPLFYNMEPSHVRFPEGEKSPYAQAFQKHNEKGRQRKEEMDEWKEALHGVSLLSGWSLRETSDGTRIHLRMVTVPTSRNPTNLNQASFSASIKSYNEMKSSNHSKPRPAKIVKGKQAERDLWIRKDIQYEERMW